MNDNPMTGDFHPAMWTYQIYDGYWRVYRRGVELGTVLSELNANSIVAAANEAEQQLAAVVEALEEISERGGSVTGKIADDAIAKIGGK